eukprot:CAMPEP_0202917988 /NCGR_PEP_ID=MMETSP1392-20130828/72343_1 /ASSEMBLY_ACC=CAM_ASM_000868 /TAXON_ID=225041 /ORGANISM="Chlamydomonas chlamydogama, Strain SAG 11-48b" /LENGTH=385 /DNA_ID=CAMNT_0049610903 /DNA_START=91 /DNA_END=1249 /DNA_ORIENTATION=+
MFSQEPAHPNDVALIQPAQRSAAPMQYPTLAWPDHQDLSAGYTAAAHQPHAPGAQLPRRAPSPPGRYSQQLHPVVPPSYPLLEDLWHQLGTTPTRVTPVQQPLAHGTPRQPGVASAQGLHSSLQASLDDIRRRLAGTVGSRSAALPVPDEGIIERGSSSSIALGTSQRQLRSTAPVALPHNIAITALNTHHNGGSLGAGAVRASLVPDSVVGVTSSEMLDSLAHSLGAWASGQARLNAPGLGTTGYSRLYVAKDMQPALLDIHARAKLASPRVAAGRVPGAVAVQQSRVATGGGGAQGSSDADALRVELGRKLEQLEAQTEQLRRQMGGRAYLVGAQTGVKGHCLSLADQQHMRMLEQWLGSTAMGGLWEAGVGHGFLGTQPAAQ